MPPRLWRVVYAGREEGRLLLLAEMRLADDGWLEFRIVDDALEQIATFRPRGGLSECTAADAIWADNRNSSSHLWHSHERDNSTQHTP